MPVLFEKRGRHQHQLVGRSPYLQAVHAAAPERLIGALVPVRLVRAAANSPAGEMLPSERAHACARTVPAPITGAGTCPSPAIGLAPHYFGRAYRISCSLLAS